MVIIVEDRIMIKNAHDQRFQIETPIMEWSRTHGFKGLLSRVRYLVWEDFLHEIVHSPSSTTEITRDHLDRGQLKGIECSMVAVNR